MSDLYDISGRVSGVVTIGDAFQTSCPAAGTGVGRALNDVELLCNDYVPRWLSSPGMDVDKISQFYDDERKRAFDAATMRSAEYRHSWATDASLRWRAHRSLRLALRRLRGFRSALES